MAWIYAVMGNKGGPGKTAELIGLADALARRGRRVAVADMDKQGNATRRLRIDKAKLIRDGRPGIAEMLDPKHPVHVRDVAVPCGWPVDYAANITVLPSLDRESLNERAEEAARPGADTRLIRALDADGWADDFHHILIDTGPDVNHLLHMAMRAADKALLVTDLKWDAIEGAVYLAGLVSYLRDAGILPYLSIGAVVVNGFDKDAARQVKHLEMLPKVFDTWGGAELIMSPTVPYRLSLANVHEDALPVSSIWHAGAAELIHVYDKHADHLIALQDGASA